VGAPKSDIDFYILSKTSGGVESWINFKVKAIVKYIFNFTLDINNQASFKGGIPK
jgi:hypothetical protein